MVNSTSDNVSALKQVEDNIKQATVHVEFGTAVERLRTNRDFKKVIVEGYFEEEAVRLVHLKADPAMQTAERQESIVKQMDAIGALNQFFQTKLHLAAMASKAIASDEETLDELLNEGGN